MYSEMLWLEGHKDNIKHQIFTKLISGPILFTILLKVRWFGVIGWKWIVVQTYGDL